MNNNYGFIYIWFDKKYNRFYIGSHWNSKKNPETDGYICSSGAMREAHRRRPSDFKRKILKRIYTNRNDLLAEEQKWLDLIPREEIGKKYYNKNTSVRFYSWWANEDTKKEVAKTISQKTKEAMWKPEIREKYLPKYKTRVRKLSLKSKESQRQKMVEWWEKKSPKHLRHISMKRGSKQLSEFHSKRAKTMWSNADDKKKQKMTSFFLENIAGKYTRKGQKNSAEHNLKISLANKGKPSKLKGIPKSEETKQKIRETKSKQNIIRVCSEETKKKTSESMKKYWEIKRAFQT